MATKTTKTKMFYALSWVPATAYSYSDDAIRALGAQIAVVVTFASKADRDDYCADDAYADPISARRAYRIDPTKRPGFGRRKRVATW